MKGQWAYNLMLALWLLSDAYRTARASVLETGPAQWLHWLLALILCANAVFVLRRQSPAARGANRGQMLWVLVAMVWPVLFTVAPGPAGPTPLPALALQFAATLMFGGSVVALGESFAVFPERRTIVSHGLYRWLRHPMYASYLLLDLGYWLANPQPWFAVVWVVEVLLLEARTRWEEDVLVADPAYAAYRARVPWRLIPGLI